MSENVLGVVHINNVITYPTKISSCLAGYYTGCQAMIMLYCYQI